MKKKQTNKNYSATVNKIFYLGILGFVFVIAIYMALTSNTILFSPPETGMLYENAATILSGFKKDGIEWYCGYKESYIDNKENVYGLKELIELKKILGNDAELYNEFCLK